MIVNWISSKILGLVILKLLPLGTKSTLTPLKSKLKFISISLIVGIRSPGQDTPFGQFVHFHIGPIEEQKGLFDTRRRYRVSKLDFPPDLVKVTDWMLVISTFTDNLRLRVSQPVWGALFYIVCSTLKTSLDQKEDMTVKKLLLVAGLLLDRWYVYKPEERNHH